MKKKTQNFKVGRYFGNLAYPADLFVYVVLSKCMLATKCSLSVLRSFHCWHSALLDTVLISARPGRSVCALNQALKWGCNGIGIGINRLNLTCGRRPRPPITYHQAFQHDTGLSNRPAQTSLRTTLFPNRRSLRLGITPFHADHC